MAEDWISRFMSHPKRPLMIWMGALLVGLVLIPPAWDKTTEARERLVAAEEELRSVEQTVRLAESYRQRIESTSTGANVEDNLIDADAAETIRLRITRLVKQAKCRLRRLKLSDELRRPWTLDGDPYQSAGLSGDSRYWLETRNLTLTVDGSLAQLAALQVAMEQLGPFVIPSEMNLRETGVHRQLTMELDLSLFGVTEDFD